MVELCQVNDTGPERGWEVSFFYILTDMKAGIHMTPRILGPG